MAQENQNGAIQHMPTNFGEVQKIGDVFAKSGMFPDVKSASQAVVKIMAGKEVGVQPFAAMTGIHIVKGKPVLGSVLLAGMVKRSGRYNYRVTHTDEKKCIIEFFEYEGGKKEKIGTMEYTLEMAKKGGTQNLDKHPSAMLFARAMSSGVRRFCPDVYMGPVYVEGEIFDESQQDGPQPYPAEADAEYEQVEGVSQQQQEEFEALVAQFDEEKAARIRDRWQLIDNYQDAEEALEKIRTPQQ